MADRFFDDVVKWVPIVAITAMWIYLFYVDSDWGRRGRAILRLRRMRTLRLTRCRRDYIEQIRRNTEALERVATVLGKQSVR